VLGHANIHAVKEPAGLVTSDGKLPDGSKVTKVTSQALYKKNIEIKKKKKKINESSDDF